MNKSFSYQGLWFWLKHIVFKRPLIKKSYWLDKNGKQVTVIERSVVDNEIWKSFQQVVRGKDG